MGLSQHCPHFESKLIQSVDFRGGIRGIVELEALRQIERALGGSLPVQSFFDLIVGTR